MVQRMKRQAVYAGILLLIVLVLTNFGEQDDFPAMKGPYLGQKPSGDTSIVFMDGIISTLENPEMCAAFTEDGKEFYFNRRYKDRWTIFLTKEVDGKWTTPQPMPFSSIYTDRDFTMSPEIVAERPT